MELVDPSLELFTRNEMGEASIFVRHPKISNQVMMTSGHNAYTLEFNLELYRERTYLEQILIHSSDSGLSL